MSTISADFLTGELRGPENRKWVWKGDRKEKGRKTRIEEDEKKLNKKKNKKKN